MLDHILALKFKQTRVQCLIFLAVASFLFLPSSNGEETVSNNHEDISKDLEKIELKIIELKAILLNLTNVADNVKTEAHELSEYLDNLFNQSKSGCQGGHFEPPHTDKTKLIKLLNRMKEIQDNITKLHSDLNGNVGNVNDIKGRTASIEQDINNILKDIDNEKRQTHQSFGQYDGMIANLTASYQKLVNDLTKRLNDMEQKAKELLIAQLIDAIINRNYNTAVNMMNKISDEQVKKVVEEVSKSVDPCDSLLALSTKIDGNKRFLIYKSLKDIVLRRNLDYACDYMKLVKFLKDYIIKSNSYNSNIKAEGSGMVDGLVNNFKAMLNEPYKSVGWNCAIETHIDESPIHFLQSCPGYSARINFDINFNGNAVSCNQS